MLAGGIGSRFWPASTKERPKQLLPLASPAPLISDTIDRARALVPDDRIRILAGAHLAEPFSTVLPDLPDAAYWIEPRARGTAPVLAWAAWKLARLDPNAVMVSLHADHLIRPVEGFVDTVRTAVAIAARDELLLSIGVTAERVETAYGHIEPGPELPVAGPAQAFRVKSFLEKPNRATAETYVRQGYLWNTGIFIWKAAVLLGELERHAPELAGLLPMLEEGDDAFFDAAPVSVIDRAAMERSGRVGVVRALFEWDDVGSWEALARTREADTDGNVVIGEARFVDGRNNIVYAEGEGSVTVLGADDLIVVRTADTTMVLPRSKAGRLKELLARLDEGVR